jgi:hypothetical protein
MEEAIEFLLRGPAYVRYNALIHLMERPESDGSVKSSREEMLNDTRVHSLMEECSAWPGPVLKRHNDASLLIHKLCFLSEIGLNGQDPGIEEIVEKIMCDQDEEGPFRILTHLYERFGGSGNDEMAWFLCDAPTVVYSLARLGYSKDESVMKARDHLISLGDENGWRCHVSRNLGKFRGPGGRKLECPYSTLIMLKLISEYPDLRDGREAKIGVNTILDLWTEREKRKPFLFAMGTDFKKLKAPMIWYDIIHVTDVLSRFDIARKDERFSEMANLLGSKADENGLYKPESIWLAWKGWDFSQKKEPSHFITFKVMNILKKMNSN